MLVVAACLAALLVALGPGASAEGRFEPADGGGPGSSNNGAYGYALAKDDRHVVVGAPEATDLLGHDGAVYVHDAADMSLDHRLVAPGAVRFGSRVDVGGGVVVAASDLGLPQRRRLDAFILGDDVERQVLTGTPPDSELKDFSIAPDGTAIVAVVRLSNPSRVAMYQWLRSGDTFGDAEMLRVVEPIGTHTIDSVDHHPDGDLLVMPKTRVTSGMSPRWEAWIERWVPSSEGYSLAGTVWEGADEQQDWSVHRLRVSDGHLALNGFIDVSDSPHWPRYIVVVLDRQSDGTYRMSWLERLPYAPAHAVHDGLLVFGGGHHVTGRTCRSTGAGTRTVTDCVEQHVVLRDLATGVEREVIGTINERNATPVAVIDHDTALLGMGEGDGPGYVYELDLGDPSNGPFPPTTVTTLPSSTTTTTTAPVDRADTAMTLGAGRVGPLGDYEPFHFSLTAEGAGVSGVWIEVFHADGRIMCGWLTGADGSGSCRPARGQWGPTTGTHEIVARFPGSQGLAPSSAAAWVEWDPLYFG